jgi:hypothetical protein
MSNLVGYNIESQIKRTDHSCALKRASYEQFIISVVESEFTDRRVSKGP